MTSRSDEVAPIYKTGDSIYQSPRLDAGTHAQNFIDYEHHEIHDGNHYNYCDYQLNNASAATIKFTVVTPNTSTWGHLTFNVFASQGATIELYESASGVSGGTSITPRNNHRNSTKTSSFSMLKDPTVSTPGTRAAGFLAGSGREAGFASRERENVLKQNTTYYFLITSLAVSNDISWCFEWYEHVSLSA